MESNIYGILKIKTQQLKSPAMNCTTDYLKILATRKYKNVMEAISDIFTAQLALFIFIYNK
jgi:hypothetical protein